MEQALNWSIMGKRITTSTRWPRQGEFVLSEID